MFEAKHDERVNLAWLTGLLTGTATNAPKDFPKSVQEFKDSMKPPKPMNPGQWGAMIDMMLAAAGTGTSEPSKVIEH